MKTKLTLFLILLFVTVVYHLLFWQEKMGVNLLLFTGLTVIISVITRPGTWRNPMWWWCTVALVITGTSVIVTNSGISKFTHGCLLLMVTAYASSSALRSPVLALRNTVAGYFNQLVNWITSVVESICRNRSGRKIWNLVRLVFIPAIIILVYVLLYSGSNATFASFFTGIAEFTEKWINQMLEQLNMPWIFFIVFGLIITSCIIMGLPEAKAFSYRIDGSSWLSRKKIPGSPYRNKRFPGEIRTFKLHAIRRELKSGVLLLVAVNILLLAYNITDIQQNWFGFTVPEKFSLKSFIHQATWYLVISILLSMAILLYYFRGNLNFYSRNRTLKILAYAWIIQNTILCISVLLRNMHYIQYHGLAYKRIGVLLFLVLTAIGLISFSIKINKLKSISWLVKFNAVAVFTSFIVMSMVNWDMKILRYNLEHPNISEIDIDFYLRLSPQTYPVLLGNLPVIEKQIAAHHAKTTRWSKVNSPEQFNAILSDKCQKFITQYETLGWPSYNLPDNTAYSSLKEHSSQFLSDNSKK